MNTVTIISIIGIIIAIIIIVLVFIYYKNRHKDNTNKDNTDKDNTDKDDTDKDDTDKDDTDNILRVGDNVSLRYYNEKNQSNDTFNVYNSYVYYTGEKNSYDITDDSVFRVDVLTKNPGDYVTHDDHIIFTLIASSYIYTSDYVLTIYEDNYLYLKKKDEDIEIIDDGYQKRFKVVIPKNSDGTDKYVRQHEYYNLVDADKDNIIVAYTTETKGEVYVVDKNTNDYYNPLKITFLDKKNTKKT